MPHKALIDDKYVDAMLEQLVTWIGCSESSFWVCCQQVQIWIFDSFGAEFGHSRLALPCLQNHQGPLCDSVVLARQAIFYSWLESSITLFGTNMQNQ